MLYFLNFFVVKLNMTLIVYAVATYFVDACIIFFACSNGVYECRYFCVKIWVVTLAVGIYDNTLLPKVGRWVETTRALDRIFLGVSF